MKKLVLIFSLLIASAVFSQAGTINSPNLNPIQQYSLIPFYNEAGTEIFNMAVGDSAATDVYPLDGNSISFTISIGYGDTLHANVYYQLVNGSGGASYTGLTTSTVKGVRRAGAEALATLSDSLNSLGAGTGAGTGAKVYLNQLAYSGFTDIVTPSSTSAGVATHDSTHTVTYTVNPIKGHYGVQFVLVGLGGTAELGNNHTTKATSLFKNAIVTIDRTNKPY